MANNRMYIRSRSTGEKMLLCKYYGSTMWYMYHDEAKLNNFLEAAQLKTCEIRKVDWTIGPTDFELVYESVEDPTTDKEL